MGTSEQEKVQLPAVSPAEKTLNLFFQYFHPATDMKEAECFYSSAELYKLLCNAGSMEGYNIDKLNDWMIEKGYKRHHIGGMELVWMLKEQH